MKMVSVEFTRALMQGMPSLGMDPVLFCEAYPALMLDYKDLPNRLSIAQGELFLKLVAQYAGDSEIVVKLAERIQPHQLGIMGYLVMTCRTLGEVIPLVSRYELLLTCVYETRELRHADHVELQWHPLLPEADPIIMKMALTTWMVLARLLTGRQELKAQACFTCSPPQDMALYERIFGMPVKFDQAMTRLIFPPAYMDLPLAQSDTQINAVIKAEADVQINRLNPLLSFAQTLEAAILHTPADVRADIGTIATSLGMSKRTLQYRLEDMGTTFQAFLDGVRCRQAEAMLRHPSMSLSDIAAQLGFANQSGFQRAFKRWRGMSPGQYRQQLNG